MAISTEEQKIAEYGKAQGKSKEQVMAAIAKYRQGSGAQTQDGGGYSLKETGQDFLQMGSDIKNTWNDAGTSIVDRFTNQPADTKKERLSNIVGAGADLFRGIGGTIGNVLMGGAKMALPQSAEDTIKEATQGVVGTIAGTQVAQDIYQQYEALDPATKEQVDNAIGYLEGATSMLAPGQGKALIESIVTNASSKARGALGATSDVIGGTLRGVGDIAPGAIQTGKEFASRVPRAFENIKSSIDDAAVRAQRIKASTPSVQEAIKVGVSEPIINTVTKADTPTIKAYKEMVDIADAPNLGIAPKKQPSSIAGESAAKQYEIIDKQRKTVGAQLGQAIDRLPDTKVSMSKPLGELDKTLRLNGMYLKGGKVMRDSASSISPTELAAINKLYDEALRGIDNLGFLDAKSIHARDRLFSKMKRESSRIDNLDDIIIKTPDGTGSIYNAFRDVYRGSLDTLSPEIGKLNKEYATYRNLVDEVDNSVFKSAKTDLKLDPAASAAVNLRRVGGDALSTPYFKTAAELLDAEARKLGYDGATPTDLIYFAEELRRLYPETIPKTGFQGGIRTGVTDLATGLLNTGAPGVKDQQKAIKAMLDDLVKAQEAGGISQEVSAMAPATKQVGKVSVSSPPKLPQTQPKATDLSTTKRQDVSSGKSTMRKIADAILPGDTPGKQGGYVKNPFSKNKIKAIDEATKDELLEVADYLKNADYYDGAIEDLLVRLADKYGIPLDVSSAKQVAYIRKLLDKTKTITTKQRNVRNG